jgi:glycosyltransferase involved in cell wall biosynthesis
MPGKALQSAEQLPVAPLFSVVIPTYNRLQPLGRCIEALAQGYPRDHYEVIVVDDGSSPPVDLRRYSDSMQIVGLRHNNRGPAPSRNAGAAQARGRYLVFLDDDCQVTSGWFSNLEKALAGASHRTIFGGSVSNGDETNLCSEVSETFIRVILQYHRPRPGGLYFFRSTNLVVPREDFLRLGGFDERFRTAEDREFCDRWQLDSGGFTYLPEAAVRHHSSLTLKSFARQHFAYGRGAWHFHHVRFSRKSPRFAIDMLAYYARVFREVTRLRQGALAARVGLFMLWQAVNIGGFLWEFAGHIWISSTWKRAA